jgi:dTDP-4-dehydrorhamnose 3,5-epimerase
VNEPVLVSTALAHGVRVRRLEMHRDPRGVFTEIFRAAWDTGIAPVQWNAVGSEAGVLRGVHVHLRHDDYLILVSGRACIGLRDLRRGSPTEGATALMELAGSDLTALTIPRGVAHGFYFHEPSVHIYSVSEYWSLEDELACHWADPALEIPWPVSSARLSDRDAAAAPLAQLLTELEPWQPLWTASVAETAR